MRSSRWFTDGFYAFWYCDYMKNADNMTPIERFEMPAKCEGWLLSPQGTWFYSGPCLVYSGQAWRQRQ